MISRRTLSLAAIVAVALTIWLGIRPSFLGNKPATSRAAENPSLQEKLAPLVTGLSADARRLLQGEAYDDILFTNRDEIFNGAASDGDANTSGRTPASCETIPRNHLAVVIIAGQSNAQNSTEPTDLYHPHQTLYDLNIDANGACFIASTHLLGTSGGGSGFGLPLGDTLIDSGMYDNVLLVPIAVGGSYIEEWRPGGRLFVRFERALRHLHAYGLEPTFILWHQGEGNAIPLAIHQTIGRSGSTDGTRPIKMTADLQQAASVGYLRFFYRIVHSLRSMGVRAPVIPAVATLCGFPSPEPAIHTAQQKLPDRDWGIFAGPDTDLLDSEYRRDLCHFNGRGIRAVAAGFFWSIARARQGTWGALAAAGRP
jgi:Carbohydrate esterase, sialic acid-specific acetylesterase